MTEPTKAPFEVVRQGCARFVPSLELLLTRWAEGCDQSPHTTATVILEASRHRFVYADGRPCVEDFPCPACGAELVAERGKPPRPACYFVGGTYGPGNSSNPRSLQFEACGAVTKPSALVEHLYPSKPKRRKFLETRCGGAKPQERRWVAARLDGKVLVSPEAEAAIDELTESTYPPAVELCLLVAIEAPSGVAELELPHVTVPLTERGEVKVLAWHGERPSGNEQGRHADWLRRAREERQREIEKRTAVFRGELERTL
jgi:hypothetical protein